MKLAVLADVHGNLAALEAVLENIIEWKPDQVIVAGDIVNRGPRPRECLRLINTYQQTLGWILLRGNHEEYVLQQGKPEAPRSGPAFDVHLASFWTYKEIATELLLVKSLPLMISLTDPFQQEVRITHASMGGIRDGIYPGMTDETLRSKIGDPPVLFCVGHTHMPFKRQVDGTLIVNVGSAGLPFDGDVRPSYARLSWQNGSWYAAIERVNYDFVRAENDFSESGYLEHAGPLSRLVLLELQQARSHLYQWAATYQELVLNGDISMKQSVDNFIFNYT